MLKSLLRIVAVGVVIILVISALNVSNQAINSLTLENSGPVLAFDLEDQDISVCFLGTNHMYSMDKLSDYIILTSQYSRLAYGKAEAHLYKTWNIFRVIFLYNL